ncbi:MAG: inner-rane translocator [Acidimicrobiia bacterium]|nr:inner-rane translocator [Acidimicrobiia bacterium]
MSTIDVAVVPVDGKKPLPPALRAIGRWAAAIFGSLAIFAFFMVAKGAGPLDAYRSMWDTLQTSTSLEGLLVKGTPLILAALAVTVPAKAGLVNVGGEGQLIIGGVAAAGMSLWLDGSTPSWLALFLMGLAAAVAAGLWAALAAALRLLVGISEAVTTLLANYIAIDVMLYLIFEKWKDPKGSGQPTSRPLAASQHLPILGSGRVHAGILVAVVATAAVWWALTHTRWGFQLRVVGGNSEAARRAGLPVGMLLLSAMFVGGALAGIGGFTQLAGAEFKLRTGFCATYGYIAFLASWLARHRPVRVAIAALVLSAISVSGDSLQLDSQLPAATVNVLMALVLLAVFGWTRPKAVSA